MKVQLLGFQHREGRTLVEKEERSVRNWYVSTGFFASVRDSMPTKLQSATS